MTLPIGAGTATIADCLQPQPTALPEGTATTLTVALLPLLPASSRGRGDSLLLRRGESARIRAPYYYYTPTPPQRSLEWPRTHKGTRSGQVSDATGGHPTTRTDTAKAQPGGHPDCADKDGARGRSAEGSQPNATWTR